ncbi:MAG TPA: aromatic ring-hydroxylating dioxygenase subunit alpha [Gemmatimonadaceae bacterium]|nr:aromatic ring-hydroxylating dioxygenase subunit alpha [Gemmatimonadaceae bacterium]
MSAFVRTIESFKQGARTMPGEYYTSPDILAEERERIFARQWNCAGRASALTTAGDFVVRDVAGESIIIVRGRDGTLRAFFNVCRHRGTRICDKTSGQFSETIQCPYHAWTYSTDGRLIGAPHMQDTDGFDKKDFPLHQAALAQHGGFLFVNVDKDPAPFESSFAPMIERFTRYRLGELVVGHKVTYDVRANWKLVFQNYSECLHCPTIHPELTTVLPYQSGANDLTEGPFLGGYMEITPPNASATLTGRACGLYVNPELSDEEHHRAFYYSLMPNMLLSIQPDYVNYYILTPVAADRTTVESEWMFAPGSASDPTFNPQDAVAFWDVTNKQDWDIVARSQLGVSSRRYEPGPYSPRESIPAAWDREYLRMMGRSAR